MVASIAAARPAPAAIEIETKASAKVAMRDAVCRIAGAVAAFALAHRERVVALDLNPLIVTSVGRVVAVDALVETNEGSQVE